MFLCNQNECLDLALSLLLSTNCTDIVCLFNSCDALIRMFLVLAFHRMFVNHIDNWFFFFLISVRATFW